MIIEKSSNTLNLKTRIQYLKGVGPKIATLLQKLGIETLDDLLLHLPRSYQDKTHLTPIRDARIGDQVVVQGTIIDTEENSVRRKSQLSVAIQDHSGVLWLRFFHMHPGLKALKGGALIRCYGEIRFYQHRKEIAHPEFKLITAENEALPAQLTPIYPATEGISQLRFQKIISEVLSHLKTTSVFELLPCHLLKEGAFNRGLDAVIYSHQPPPDADQSLLSAKMHPASLRLAFEELVTRAALMFKIRSEREKTPANPLILHPIQKKQFLDALPYALTHSQVRVLTEIETDLASAFATARLVQGDVGCGKTVVAAAALLQAVLNGVQTALMAPTELLADQHFQNLKKWFEPFLIPVYSLSRKTSTQDRTGILKSLAEGVPAVVVGTHALFQEDVQFKSLALMVIDEQHRFGVEQRLALLNKGQQRGVSPHQLMMTATPIPRTLAMAAYADVEHSVINELPKGRIPITTLVLNENKRDELLPRIKAITEQGQQIYWVCALIEESEQLACQTAEAALQYLEQALPDLNIGLIHGRLTPQKKDERMLAFKSGYMHILVATTVVEVGVDVPNASLMVIENAERMGLAQAHQLRGRVGRGGLPGYCILLYQAPLSDIARERLEILRSCQDGFKIAEADLKLRGPGELLGVEQSGQGAYRIADLTQHAYLLPRAEQVAKQLLLQHPETLPHLASRWMRDKRAMSQV